MKAAVIESKGVLTVRDLPAPETGAYGARCEILYGAVCTGTDQHLLNQDLPFRNWVRYPAILGHESIGRVVEVGPKVRNLKQGDLVTRVSCPPVGDVGSAWGGFAETGIALDWRAMEADGRPRTEWNSARVNQVLPPEMDPAAATLMITWRETYSQLKRMGFGAGQSLAVMGSGSNGLAFAAHARNLGAGTLTLIGSPKREAEARRVGVTAFVDYRAEDAKAQALAACPDGYDFVLDVVGRPEMADLGLGLLKAGGIIATYGMDDAASIRLNPGLARGAFTVLKPNYDEAEAHADVVALFQAKKLDPAVWLDFDRVFALDEINEAMAAARARTVVKPLVRICG